jgi:pimeloyl-ACP methyl ester carboxylesterase
MRPFLELAAVAGAIALATWAHYRFWSWRLRLPLGADELLFAATADGWSLALARRRPRAAARPLPVLLVHGVAANGTCMDFPMGRLSLAAHLAGAGFDCYSLDLRGHGRSRRARPDAPRGAGFDDYLREDLPAAIDAVRARTGAARVALVGHSQGALLALAASALRGERVAAVVAMAGPAHFDAQHVLRTAARFGFLVTGALNRFLARSFAPFSGWWHPPVSQVAWNANNVDGPVYRRVLANVVENIPAGVLRQFGGWIRSDRWASLDGAIDYRAALARASQPALFVAAADDLIAPPAVVAASHAAWGGSDKALWVAGRQGGCGCEYGHSDLLFGRTAPDEVFPRIREWLERVIDA